MSEVNPVQHNPEQRKKGENIANSMKNIRKKRMQREVYADASKAAELVRIESSPVYNAKGEVIQAASAGHGEV